MNIETTFGYCPICATEVDSPVDTIVALAAAPGLIAEAVRAAPSETRAGWSPAEVAAHLADTEVVTGWRLRQILAEGEPTIQPTTRRGGRKRCTMNNETRTWRWRRLPWRAVLTRRSCGYYRSKSGSDRTSGRSMDVRR